MNYVENNLQENEIIIKKAEISVMPHVYLLPIGLGFVTIWKPLIAKFTTELALTNKKIIGRVGLISIKAMDSKIEKVDNIKIEMSLLGRIFNYGNIYINSYNGSFVFKYIKNPNEFKKMINDEIEKTK